jgi:prepilin-type N-terminal cleavage/methylation domain-containing protein
MLPIRRTAAFTLIEVLIVVVILGILAAIVVPQFADAGTEAMTSTLQANVRMIRDVLQEQYHRSGTSTYPATIDTAWFASGTLPRYPTDTFGLDEVEVVATAGLMHPANKVLKAGVAGAYWYNSAEGKFHARVIDQGTAAATLDLYNLVNGSNEVDLGNYGGGGGS